MLFHRARIKNCSSKVHNKHVTFIRCISGIVDDKLIDNHISYIKNKISQGLGIQIKSRKYLNRIILVNLYYTFVYPYLIYCFEIWGIACHIYLDSLVKLLLASNWKQEYLSDFQLYRNIYLEYHTK